MLKNPTLIWFVVGLLMFVLEMAGPGFVILFFAIGAWIVMILTLFIKMSLNIQLALFLILSILSLILFRNVLKKAFHGHEVDEQDLEKNLNEFVGEKVKVVETIVLNVGGKVEFRGSVWEAHAQEEIPEGEIVRIVDRDNLTLKVQKLQ